MKKITLEKLLNSYDSDGVIICNSNAIDAEFVQSSDDEYDEETEGQPEEFLATNLSYDVIKDICEDWQITFFYSDVLCSVLIPYVTSESPERYSIYGVE